MVYAADGLWWRTYVAQVCSYQLARCLTADASVSQSLDIEFVPTKLGPGLAQKGAAYIHRHHSSAHQAVGLLVQMGVTEIVLVGVDCKADAAGKKHWFGDHPPRFLAPQPFDLWIEDWKSIAVDAKQRSIRIVNCSIDSAVECFERSTLDKELFV